MKNRQGHKVVMVPDALAEAIEDELAIINRGFGYRWFDRTSWIREAIKEKLERLRSARQAKAHQDNRQAQAPPSARREGLAVPDQVEGLAVNAHQVEGLAGNAHQVERLLVGADQVEGLAGNAHQVERLLVGAHQVEGLAVNRGGIRSVQFNTIADSI